jgi:NADH-quinone oxidoreductase subunit N
MHNPLISLANFQALWPELIVLLGAMLCLAIDIPLRAQKNKGAVAAVAALTLLAALAALGMNWHAADSDPFTGMLRADGLARVAKLSLLLIGLMTLLVGRRISAQAGLVYAEYYSLLLFALAAMMLFAGATNLMMAFVALETFSLAMYVLAGFNRRSKANREAALKYFLIGAFAAGFFLFGLAITYGASGSVSLGELPAIFAGLAPEDPRRHLLYAGLGLLMVGLGFKVGLAPFHLWAPDTYEGAPSPISAFLSAGAKVAGFAALIRLAMASPMNSPALVAVVSALAILTMTLGNLGALKQQGLKRLMAYSSVAHSGYALVALAGGSPLAPAAVMNYVFTYAFMNFCAFGLIIALEQDSPTVKEGGQLTLADVQGLGFEKPLFGFALAVCMFAMAGIPPTAGFIAKLNVFKAALSAGQVTLVVIAVLNSVVSAAYYLRVLVALYMKPKAAAERPLEFKGLLMWGSLACLALILAWGVLPASLMALTSF